VKDRLFVDANLNVKIESHPLATIPCDINVQIVRQVCLNILKNCAFHSGANSLLIKVDAHKLESKIHFSIHFIDDGKGISDEHKEQLFEAFTRGETHADGTGLGLHISREFARNFLDGDLTFEENPNGGAIFSLTLVVPIASEISEPDTSIANQLAGKRVLFVEDNPVIQKLSNAALKKQGAVVTIASNGLAALEAMTSESYDVIITDLFMPEMNGYELTEAIRATGNTIPIIGLTAATVGDETDKLLQSGANAVIEKPINMDKINQALAKLS
jgi:CheY-like chemotaxis protein